MTSFAQAIRTFQSDGQSRDEFFARIDGVLATNREPAARLLQALDEENAAKPLPPDVYAAVRWRVEGGALQLE